ncbi:MAG: NADH:ubiquinone reductase (Na(+)-transporting) subunit B [Acidobacteria bacterium]|nr:NADH:ubiquinone reductase (Na(+)-transporting) subunit B [Acidobacteriota bacterium]
MSNPLDPEKLFGKGAPLERLYPLFEATETIVLTPGKVTRGASHVRDALDLKRMMITVVVALVPAILFGIYNIGYQAHWAIEHGAEPLDTWQTQLFQLIGLQLRSDSILSCFTHGLLYYLPVMIVTGAIGGNLEALFAIIRKHEINEGFLVTWMLFPLILPPTIPLWQVGLGIAFAVIIAKEIFGGTGMNILNVALAGRAFLFFAYPAQMSGDKVWIAADTRVDGVSGATALANAAVGGLQALQTGTVTWWDAFLGFIPGSVGETSTLAALLGAVVLIATGVGSWRIMAGVVLGTIFSSGLLNLIGSSTNAFFDVPFWWHMVLGGWAFGMVFMATDPVSAAHSLTGKYVYGFFIGLLVVLIRVVNPAYPEGMMLAILFMNLFAAFIDYWIVQANIKRRAARYAA